MAKAAQRPEFWAAVVAEAQAGGASHAEIAAKHGVTEAAFKYHFYKASKRPATAKHVPVLSVRVGDEARLISVELGGSLRLRFAEGCDPGYVAALVAKLR
jgi:transposase-like protein